MKELSSGVILTDGFQFLICHPTNQPKNKWDIPKGKLDNVDLNYKDCAWRELYEETNLKVIKDYLLPVLLNEYYTKNKNLNIYIYKIKKLPDLKELKCNSYFDFNGNKIPEIDEYKYISFSEIENYLFKSLVPIIKKSLEITNIEKLPYYPLNDKVQTIFDYFINSIKDIYKK